MAIYPIMQELTSFGQAIADPTEEKFWSACAKLAWPLVPGCYQRYPDLYFVGHRAAPNLPAFLIQPANSSGASFCRRVQADRKLSSGSAKAISLSFVEAIVASPRLKPAFLRFCTPFASCGKSVPVALLAASSFPMVPAKSPHAS